MERLRIHHLIPASRANGPGMRAVIWVQGCTLGCPGCFNAPTHDPRRGNVVPGDALFDQIFALKDTIEGVTISGGEPLQQRRGLEPLLARIRRETNLSVLLFSGYTWQEIQSMPRAQDLLAGIDVLLAGRYDQRERLATGMLGSANKTIHFLTGRYTLADLQAVPEAEVILTPDGELIFSGIEPLQW